MRRITGLMTMTMTRGLEKATDTGKRFASRPLQVTLESRFGSRALTHLTSATVTAVDRLAGPWVEWRLWHWLPISRLFSFAVDVTTSVESHVGRRRGRNRRSCRRRRRRRCQPLTQPLACQSRPLGVKKKRFLQPRLHSTARFDEDNGNKNDADDVPLFCILARGDARAVGAGCCCDGDSEHLFLTASTEWT